MMSSSGVADGFLALVGSCRIWVADSLANVQAPIQGRRQPGPLAGRAGLKSAPVVIPGPSEEKDHGGGAATVARPDGIARDTESGFLRVCSSQGRLQSETGLLFVVVSC